MPWQTELLRDKSLWAVFRSSFRASTNFTNLTIAWGWLCLATIVLAANGMMAVPLVSAAKMAEWSVSIAGDGLAYTSQILGFLIAGVALFTTSVRRRVLDDLGVAQQEGRGRSYLKAIFCEFIIVFIFHISCLFICIFAKLTLADQSAVKSFGATVTSNMPLVQLTMVSAVALLVSQSLVAALLALKSFVWNLYQIVIVILAMRK